MMDWRLVVTVLVIYILIGPGEGKKCEVSRARLNPTLYYLKTCPGECCSDLSFKLCCEVPDELNVTVVVVFCVVTGLIIIAIIVGVFCCYKYQKKKVLEEEEDDKESYQSEEIGHHYRDVSRHHGHPNPRYE
ncbi:uncharacterized protein LOC117339978 [Pecten maximus]|uniref:uncharacterized protein LOC117339978 n=1 Tax=Pecten maximus TaxID=6579 RepID=UPI0014588A09|nr:uncharacterized protein LOC117339978 [Pecten maximus]